MALGPSSTQGILRIEVCPIQRIAPCFPRSNVAIYGGDGCISRCYWRSIDAGLGGWPTTSGLHELSFEPTEQWYSAYKKELAVVAYYHIQWRHYLESCLGGVTVVIDHQPLIHLMEQQVLSRTQLRWVRLGLLQSINPKFKYHSGKANVITNVLSRSRPHRTENQEIDHLA